MRIQSLDMRPVKRDDVVRAIPLYSLIVLAALCELDSQKLV